MPQGSRKVKTQVPGRKSIKKHTRQKRSAGLNKRGRYIAPKKENVVKLSKLRKNLERAIGNNIEKEVVALATSREPRPMTVVSQPAPDVQGKKNSKKKSQQDKKK